MTAVRKLREAINETTGRWESAAASLETCIASSRTAAARVESLRQEAARTAGKLQRIVVEARELSPEARQRTVSEICRFRKHLGQGKINDAETYLICRKNMERSRQALEQRLDRIFGDVHPDFEQAVRDWVRAQMELETGLELMDERLACERAGDRARFEARRQEMLRSIEQFRSLLKEKRFSATRQGRLFGPEMNAAYQRIRNTLYHPAG